MSKEYNEKRIKEIDDLRIELENKIITKAKALDKLDKLSLHLAHTTYIDFSRLVSTVNSNTRFNSEQIEFLTRYYNVLTDKEYRFTFDRFIYPHDAVMDKIYPLSLPVNKTEGYIMGIEDVLTLLIYKLGLLNTLNLIKAYYLVFKD